LDGALIGKADHDEAAIGCGFDVVDLALVLGYFDTVELVGVLVPNLEARVPDVHHEEILLQEAKDPVEKKD